LIPTPETEGFIRQPEETNRGYGWSKRMAELAGELYHQEFGMSIAIARPFNCYGPRDNFNPEESHVIPGVITRFLNGENPFKIWGTGEQSRSFLYVKDFARGLLEVLEKYPEADPLNIGADEEITIKELVLLIRELLGKTEVLLEHDLTKPIGQPRRHCNITKAVEKIGWQPEYGLRQGLQETIDWYLHTRSNRP
jgi:nucleoside-diphosphate-sugar epimerase